MSIRNDNLDNIDRMDNLDEKSPDEIRAEIERTRADMGETVDSIEHQVSPDNLKSKAQDALGDISGEIRHQAEGVAQQASEVLGDLGNNLVEVIRNNPVPAALVGVGLSWLAMSGSRSQNGGGSRAYSSGNPYPGTGQTYGGGYTTGYTTGMRNPSYPGDRYGYSSQRNPSMGERAGGVADSARDKAGQMAGEAQEQLGELGQNIREQAESWGQKLSSGGENLGGTMSDQAEHFSHEAQHQARRAQRGLERAMNENPLVVGAVAVMAGAALGLMLPRTSYEDEVMGGTRDDLLDRAKDAAQSAQQVAEKSLEQVKDTVQEEAQARGLSAESVKEDAKGAVKEARDVVKNATDDAKDTAKREAEREGLTDKR